MRCSADRKLLTETMIQEIEKVVLKMFDFIYQDGLNIYAKRDNFCVSIFHSEETITKVCSQGACNKYTNVKSTID